MPAPEGRGVACNFFSGSVLRLKVTTNSASAVRRVPLAAAWKFFPTACVVVLVSVFGNAIRVDRLDQGLYSLTCKMPGLGGEAEILCSS